MRGAVGSQITIEGEECVFQVSGKTIDFPGYLRAYVEGSDDPDAVLADQEKTLPSVEVGEQLTCQEMDAKQHITQPPGRYSEAALTKALEERGIGRPSTYASIIDTILARNYVFKKANALVPTWVAFSVIRLLEEHLGNLVDYQFTAQMEDDLDAISRGERSLARLFEIVLFWQQQQDQQAASCGPQTSVGKQGRPDRCPRHQPHPDRQARRIERTDLRPRGPLFSIHRTGRTDRVVAGRDATGRSHALGGACKLLEQAQLAAEPLGTCPETNKPVYLKVGRFGPYVQRGNTDDEEKPQNATLLKGMDPDKIDLETALKLLSLPRNLGDYPLAASEGPASGGPAPADQKPEPGNDSIPATLDGTVVSQKNGETAKAKPAGLALTGPVLVHNGRYGPYVKCGHETRSLPAELSPLEITLGQAVQLLSQPKTRGRGATRKPPLKVFDTSPVTEKPVQILDGRYGPYLTDGTTNFSLRKGMVVRGNHFRQSTGPTCRKSGQRPREKKSGQEKIDKEKAGNQEESGKEGGKKESREEKIADQEKRRKEKISSAPTAVDTEFRFLVSPRVADLDKLRHDADGNLPRLIGSQR